MKSNKTTILKFLVRWGIAVVGIAWIVMQLTIRDRVNVVLPNGLVASTPVLSSIDDNGDSVPDRFVTAASATPLSRDELVSQPDRKTVSVHRNPQDASTPIVDAKLLGLHLLGDLNALPAVASLIIENPAGAGGLRITPAEVVGGFRLKTPRPVVEFGLASMARHANPWLLALAILVFPLTAVITTLRWNQILRSQEIRLPFMRVFVLNMVGNFYNSFFPGSTGGDFLKAFYVSRQTSHKIRAMVSVFVDRVIGLLALVMLGGAMAAYGFLSTTDLGAFTANLAELKGFSFRQWILEGNAPDLLAGVNPTARACLGVTIACLLICIASVVGAAALASKRARRLLGFNWFVSKLPMQHHLDKVRESMRLYRTNARYIAWWILMTLPIHSTVVVSAMIAGQAFGLPIQWPYYFVCVPVMVLVAALPISPQGAGVMEYFGFVLLSKQGVNVSQVLALTLSIRFVQIFWNLIGGLFTLRGEFGAPTASYDAIADEDIETIDATRSPAPAVSAV